jgi:hypothetical protein
MADINTAFVLQVFDILQGKRKPDVHHHRKADDFGRRFKIAKGI